MIRSPATNERTFIFLTHSSACSLLSRLRNSNCGKVRARGSHGQGTPHTGGRVRGRVRGRDVGGIHACDKSASSIAPEVTMLRVGGIHACDRSASSTTPEATMLRGAVGRRPNPAVKGLMTDKRT